MENDKSLRYNSFFIRFNPFLQCTEWDTTSEKAQKYFIDFLNENEYGDDVMSITFNFFVEEEIDLNKQKDNITTVSRFGTGKNARLNLHFDYEYFINAPEEIKYKMTLNGILYLLDCWNNSLQIPKGTPLKKIIEDYKNKLVKDNFFVEANTGKYIKLKK